MSEFLPPRTLMRSIGSFPDFGSYIRALALTVSPNWNYNTAAIDAAAVIRLAAYVPRKRWMEIRQEFLEVEAALRGEVL
jgi:hypothetical protein